MILMIVTRQDVACDRDGCGVSASVPTHMSAEEYEKALVERGNWAWKEGQLICSLCRALDGDFGKESRSGAQKFAAKLKKPKA